jgi:uncharacterized protein
MDRILKTILAFLKISPSYRFIVLSDISLDWLIENHAKGLILDLDNTIISEDDQYISPEVEYWVNQVQDAGIQIFLLSNGSRKSRFLYWSERLHLSGICRAKKPFKAGFKRAIRSMNLNPASVIVIGDSVHTDILGAKLSSLRSIQVASLPHPKRWWENLMGDEIQMKYPPNYPLDLNTVQE